MMAHARIKAQPTGSCAATQSALETLNPAFEPREGDIFHQDGEIIGRGFYRDAEYPRKARAKHERIKPKMGPDIDENCVVRQELSQDRTLSGFKTRLVELFENKALQTRVRELGHRKP
jgi:hypothetical protein